MSNSINASDEVVFEYTGIGCVVPKDVTIVRFHPDGIEVEGRAFSYCIEGSGGYPYGHPTLYSRLIGSQDPPHIQNTP